MPYKRSELKNPRRLSGSCITMLILLVVIVILFMVTKMPLSVLNPFSGGPKPTTDPATTVDAAQMCKTFVTEKLLAPKTADFQNVYDAISTEISTDTFLVKSYVDEENVFGVPIRLNYQCKINYIGNDQWRLIDLQQLP